MSLADTLTEVAALTAQPKISGAGDVAFNPDGDRIAVAGYYANSIVVYSFVKATNTLTEVAALTAQPKIDGAWDVAFNPDGDRIAVTGYLADSIVVYSFVKATNEKAVAVEVPIGRAYALSREEL